MSLETTVLLRASLIKLFFFRFKTFLPKFQNEKGKKLSTEMSIYLK